MKKKSFVAVFLSSILFGLGVASVNKAEATSCGLWADCPAIGCERFLGLFLQHVPTQEVAYCYASEGNAYVGNHCAVFTWGDWPTECVNDPGPAGNPVELVGPCQP